MLSPIQRLIRLNPTPAVIRTTAPADYDPAADEDYKPGQPFDTWLYGAYSGVKSEGSDFTATLTVETLPPLTAADNSRVHLEDGDYGIKHIRPRRRFGVISGYTLELDQ